MKVKESRETKRSKKSCIREIKRKGNKELKEREVAKKEDQEGEENKVENGSTESRMKIRRRIRKGRRKWI